MNVTEELHALVADEPPYLLDPDAALEGGRRRRRARTTGLTAAAGAAAVVVTGALVALQPSSSGVRDSVTAPTFGAPGTAAPVGEIEAVVRANTPVTGTISNTHLTPYGFQADVDDGQGASRLYIGLSPSPGSLQQHPCSDHEFALDGSCKEIEVDADTRMILRGPAGSGPVTSVTVVIVHRDGSGVDVGNDSATWEWVESGTVLTPEDKAELTRPRTTRGEPVYSLNQLVRIAKAVDAAR